MKVTHIIFCLITGLGVASPTCSAPKTKYSTLPDTFTMDVLAGKKSFNIYFLSRGLTGPNGKPYSKPLITSRDVTPLKFKLTDGTLYQAGRPAHANYVVPPGSTTVQEWLFGGNNTVPSNEKFSAGYSCDANNKKILILQKEEGFTIGSEDEGAEIYIIPTGYSGSTTDDFIRVKLEINGGL